MQQLETKFLDLIEGRIEGLQAESVRAEIDSDAATARAFKRASDVHMQLTKLREQDFAVDRLFKEEVMTKVNAAAAAPSWSRCIRAVRVPFIALTGILCLWALIKARTLGPLIVLLLTLLEGSFGAVIMLMLAAAVVMTAAKRRYRWTAALAGCCFACFLLRASMATFFNTDSVQGLEDGDRGIEYNDTKISDAVGLLLGRKQDAGLADRKIAVPQSPSTAAFRGQNPEPASRTETEPTSTFSFDVDTASYSLVRKYLTQGKLPPPDAVRAEELINYFVYDYPAPKSETFGVSYELAPSPFKRGAFLLRIGLQSKGQQLDDKPWNLVFLLDVSGSMADDDKLPLIKRGFEALVSRLRPIDRVAIVTYSDTATLALHSTVGSEKLRIRSVIENLQASGSTNGAGGIDLAYATAMQNFMPGGVNRVILATDGDFNVGRYTIPELMQLAEDKLRRGVSLTAIGVGNNNLKDDKLEQLASKGDGNYFFLDSVREAQKIFGRSLGATVETVAKNMKGQVEFNPAYVAAHRLIGYTNRKITREEFYDERTHAAEVGSGQSLTLLYELSLRTSPAERSLPKEKQRELAFLTIKYKDPAGASKEQNEAIPAATADASRFEPSQDFLFAAAVAQFAENLGPENAPVSMAEVERIARGAIGSDPDGYRSEFIDMVRAADRIRGERVEVPAGRYEQ